MHPLATNLAFLWHVYIRFMCPNNKGSPSVTWGLLLSVFVSFIQDKEALERMKLNLVKLQDRLAKLETTAQEVIEQNQAQQTNIDVRLITPLPSRAHVPASFDPFNPRICRNCSNNARISKKRKQTRNKPRLNSSRYVPLIFSSCFLNFSLHMYFRAYVYGL